MSGGTRPRSAAPAKADNRPGAAARTVATALLSAVLDDHKPLDIILDAAGDDLGYRALEPRDRGLARAIVGTALRRHGTIGRALAKLMQKGPPRRSGRLLRIVEIAAAQLLFMEVPDHAAVSIAIDAVGADPLGQHFKGFANGVLRRLARERATILAGEDEARLDTPDWLWQRWSRSYGEDIARRIAEAHRLEPSLDLSVKRDAPLWAERLGGIVLPTGTVRLVPSGPVEALPGYDEGEWWVQDAAAALGPRLLGDVAGKRVADLCAAPGGKTAALAQAGAIVTAVDISAPRLERLKTNLARLHLSAETVAADVLKWTGPDPLFDAVLLDAPCTATGTIRRHPDVAWLKRAEDIAKLADLQGRMIDRAVALLKPGGMLVYCTCSLEPEEGEAHLARALDRHPLTLVPVEPGEIGGLAEAVTPAGTLRTLPCHLAAPAERLSGLDGFFMMRLRKA